MSKIQNMRVATEGEKFTWRGEERTIQPKKEGKAGRWACVRCSYLCDHNLDKDSHVSQPVRRGTRAQPGGPDAPGEQANHVLAWLSADTGDFEVP